MKIIRGTTNGELVTNGGSEFERSGDGNLLHPAESYTEHWLWARTYGISNTAPVRPECQECLRARELEILGLLVAVE